MKSEATSRLWNQITDAAGNVLYTYDAHWLIVNRLKTRERGIKVFQIILTALSAGGFLTSVIAGIPWLSWVGGLTSALALALNLYALSFDLPTEIKRHTDAANDLWDVRESYKALMVDFDTIAIDEIRKRRDAITKAVSRINKSYPGTDAKAFAKAQKNIGNYTFSAGESAKLLNVESN